MAAHTLLEQTRQLHEDLEKAERLIVKQYREEAKSHKEKLLQSHRVRKLLDLAQDRAQRLVTVYDDEDGARKEEIAALRGDNVFGNFYDRLREVREFHRRFPDNDITEGDNDDALVGADPIVPFSGEEGLGRYLDLHEQQQAFLNSKFGRELDYYTYVASLADFAAIPRQQRLGRPYRDYLSGLLAYLESFYRRTQPLAQLAKQEKKVEEELEGRWGACSVEGWEDRGEGAGPEEVGSSGLDLDAFDSVEELELLGADRLKEALQALGLKCGGTLRQRAERLMAIKGRDLSQVDKSLFAKGAKAALGEKDLEARRATAHDAALLEAKVAKLCDMLSSVIEDTKGRIEKKQAQTYEELLAEQQEGQEEVVLAESDEEEEYIYNPLKLPLGWDGKPIPYWLYKLHGLNMEFKCEICGNASYWGRRAFERHFKEWRHQNGMKALGIPNTKQFFEVTTIADALALWKNLQEREKGGFKAEQDEEFEDVQGNVYNRKTYEDLKRQGLI